MTGSRAATRYAKAILGYAQEQGTLEAVHSDMLEISKVVESNKELRQVIESPVIKSKLKSNVLKEVFSGCSDSTEKLFALLLENNRIEIIGMVADKFIVRYDELKGKETAVVTTAVALTEELEAKILEKVRSLTGKEISLEKIVDDSIIGGFILRVGDQQFDASIANKLNNLKRDFVKRAIVSA